MAGLVLGLVGGAVRAVTGGSRHHDTVIVAPGPCTCHQPYCQQCAVDPVWMSRRELRREYRNERRSLKHARKAARWGYPVAVCHGHHQDGYGQPQQQYQGYAQPQGYAQQGSYPQQQSYSQQQGGYPQQGYPPQQQGYRGGEPQPMQYRSMPNDQAPRSRRASFDEEDLLDQPPQYEPGNWEQQRQQQRRSVEVLTSEKKN